MLDRLQMQLDERQEALRNAKDRLIILENQIKANQNMRLNLQKYGREEESGEVLTLALMKQQLAALQTSYTDRHPDVIRLKSKIADLEAKIDSGEISTTQMETFSRLEHETGTYICSQTSYRNDEGAGSMKRDRAELKLEIKNLNIEIAKYRKRDQ